MDLSAEANEVSWRHSDCVDEVTLYNTPLADDCRGHGNHKFPHVSDTGRPDVIAFLIRYTNNGQAKKSLALPLMLFWIQCKNTALRYSTLRSVMSVTCGMHCEY